MHTIASRMAITNNRSSGFDYMRLALATSIILFHTVVTSYGVGAQTLLDNSFAGLAVAQLVPMFFCLSGFLVAGSLERSKTVISFLGLRGLRIFPALCAETLLSAFILGPLFTLLPLVAYFTDPHMWSYLHNLHGDIHYYLPGVFTRNPIDRVNGQLWTIPGELKCYAWITAAMLLTLTRRRWALLACFSVYMAFGFWRGAVHHYSPVGFVMPLEVLVECFFAGVLLYLFRERVVWNRALGLLACTCSLGLAAIHYGIWFLAVPASYATVWLGLMNPRKPAFMATGDYSYGLYLYGYPIQQAVAAFAPLRHWWLNLVIAYPLAFAFAALSWHLLEKRMLKLRKPLFAIEAWIVEKLTRAPQALTSFKDA